MDGGIEERWRHHVRWQRTGCCALPSAVVFLHAPLVVEAPSQKRRTGSGRGEQGRATFAPAAGAEHGKRGAESASPGVDGRASSRMHPGRALTVVHLGKAATGRASSPSRIQVWFPLGLFFDQGKRKFPSGISLR